MPAPPKRPKKPNASLRKRRPPTAPMGPQTYANGMRKRQQIMRQTYVSQGDSLPASQAARKLGLSIDSIRRLCAAGRLGSFRSGGGHLRIPLEAIENFRGQGRGAGSGGGPSPVLRNRRERIEELSLEAQELRAKRELKKLRDEESREEAQHAAEEQAEREEREQQRERIRSEQAERLRLIANPAACGEGINLHRACHRAIYLDRTFNAAHYLQSIDRIHRLGLEENILTSVVILDARATIDARVATRLKAKIDSMSLILNDPGLAALAYDPLDVIEEFPAGIQPEDVEEIMEHIVQGDRDEE